MGNYTTSTDTQEGNEKPKRHIIGFKTEKAEPFAKIHINNRKILFNISSFSKNMMLELVYNMNYENEIRISAEDRIGLSKFFDTSMSTVNHSLLELEGVDLLKKKGIGYYMINPNIYAKGSFRGIKKMIDIWINLKHTK